jgi:hypothetical protein
MLIVLLAPTERTMPEETNLNEIELVTLEDNVIQLHNIARHIEKTIGQGQLSDDIRKAADRLSELLHKY